MKKVLFAGESWISYSRHIKGFDSFFTAKYEEGIQWIKKSIEKAGYEFCYISNTYAAEKFPRTLEELKEYDAVFLSDIGSNTLLITNQCFAEGKTILTNAAKEPEIEDLAKFLNKAGAKISGIGTDRLEINGVKKLNEISYNIMPDRI